MAVVRWKIWYDDGSTFSSDDGDPNDAPLDGVQAIVQWRSNGKVEVFEGPLEGHEFYIWTGDCWAYGNRADLERWTRKLLPQLKYGRFTSDTIHKKIMEEVSGSRGR